MHVEQERCRKSIGREGSKIREWDEVASKSSKEKQRKLKTSQVKQMRGGGQQEAGVRHGQVSCIRSPQRLAQSAGDMRLPPAHALGTSVDGTPTAVDGSLGSVEQ